MHSRIFQISERPIAEEEYLSESDVPEWFLSSVADYVDSDTDRENDIKWLLDSLRDAAVYRAEDDSFVLPQGAKQHIMHQTYDDFCAVVRKLANITLDEFAGETPSDVFCDVLSLKQAYADDFGFYIATVEDGIITFPEWLRSSKKDCRYYIGNTLDYHW